MKLNQLLFAVPSQTKTFCDGLGRRTAVAENYVNYVHSTGGGTGIGGGTNNEQDRVTGWTYNGLGQTVKLIAYNASASTADQVTEYKFGDVVNASLCFGLDCAPFVGKMERSAEDSLTW